MNSLTITAPEATTSLETAPPRTAKSKGDKGSRRNRGEKRRDVMNARLDTQPTEKSGHPSALTELLPAFSTRPGGILVAPIGMSIYFHFMLIRARSVAQRQLANVMTPDNINILKKVLSYLIYTRIVASHILQPYVVGEPVSFSGALTSDQMRAIDGNCSIVINAFAWAMSHLGRFADEDNYSIPIVQARGDDACTVTHLQRGLFIDIVEYIRLHSTNGRNAEATAIPAVDRPMVNDVATYLGLAIHRDRFTDATYDLWVIGAQQVSPDEWTIWREFNAAAHEQQLTVSGFRFSEALGSLSQIVRFQTLQPVDDLNTYYCVKTVDAQTIRDAIILRLGQDHFNADGPHRYVNDNATALLLGNDVPAPYMHAQLTMISKNQIKK